MTIEDRQKREELEVRIIGMKRRVAYADRRATEWAELAAEARQDLSDAEDELNDFLAGSAPPPSDTSAAEQRDAAAEAIIEAYRDGLD